MKTAAMRTALRGEFSSVFPGPLSVPAALLEFPETAPDHVGSCREEDGQDTGHEEEWAELVHGLLSFGCGPSAAGAGLGTFVFGQSDGLQPLHRKPRRVSYRFSHPGRRAWGSEARLLPRCRLPVTSRRRMLAGS